MVKELERSGSSSSVSSARFIFDAARVGLLRVRVEQRAVGPLITSTMAGYEAW